MSIVLGSSKLKIQEKFKEEEALCFPSSSPREGPPNVAIHALLYIQGSSTSEIQTSGWVETEPPVIFGLAFSIAPKLGTEFSALSDSLIAVPAGLIAGVLSDELDDIQLLARYITQSQVS